jgi:hypothetical protein
MKRTVAAHAHKETTTLPTSKFWQHAAVRAVPKHEMSSNAPPETRFDHDFSRATVRSSAPLVGREYGTTACPMFPQTCPFGGACHMCPAQASSDAKSTIGQHVGVSR